MSSSVRPSAKYSSFTSGADVGEGEDGESRRPEVRSGRNCCLPEQDDSIDLHGEPNVPEYLRRQLLESVGNLVSNLTEHGFRDADPPRLGEGLDPRSDVHGVSEDVCPTRLDIPQVDPDP